MEKHSKIVIMAMMMVLRILWPACVRIVKNGQYQQSKRLYKSSVFRCKIDRSSSNEGLTIGLVSSVLGVLVGGVMAGVMGVAWRKTGFSWIGTFVRVEYSEVWGK